VFAEEWDLEIATIRDWPACKYCYGTGQVFHAGSPFDDETGPCQCLSSEEVALSFPYFDTWKSAIIAGLLFCARCSNTGVSSIGTACSCEVGSRRASEMAMHTETESRRNRENSMQAREEEAQRMAERGAYEQRFICPDCKGEKELNGESCVHCNGTGEFHSWEELSKAGKCPNCYGTCRRGNRNCLACRGSGEHSRPAPKMKRFREQQ
jgi:hypothetical protein